MSVTSSPSRFSVEQVSFCNFLTVTLFRGRRIRGQSSGRWPMHKILSYHVHTSTRTHTRTCAHTHTYTRITLRMPFPPTSRRGWPSADPRPPFSPYPTPPHPTLIPPTLSFSKCDPERVSSYIRSTPDDNSAWMAWLDAAIAIAHIVLDPRLPQHYHLQAHQVGTRRGYARVTIVDHGTVRDEMRRDEMRCTRREFSKKLL